jgi:hypothetical protein
MERCLAIAVATESRCRRRNACRRRHNGVAPRAAIVRAVAFVWSLARGLGEEFLFRPWTRRKGPDGPDFRTDLT